jgi:hypothetical protein
MNGAEAYQVYSVMVSDKESFVKGWDLAIASMRPHLDQLAAQLGVAPVGDLTGELEGVSIGAVQARIG